MSEVCDGTLCWLRVMGTLSMMSLMVLMLNRRQKTFETFLGSYWIHGIQYTYFGLPNQVKREIPSACAGPYGPKLVQTVVQHAPLRPL